MNGLQIPDTPIVVDYWRQKDVPPRSLFFLTHIHAGTCAHAVARTALCGSGGGGGGGKDARDLNVLVLLNACTMCGRVYVCIAVFDQGGWQTALRCAIP